MGEETGALALSARIASGAQSLPSLMEETLDRIGASRTNAVVSLRTRAELMAEAEAMAREAPRGWLHGIPLAVKDLVATAGIRTTYGSPIHADLVPKEDDLLAERLRGAGAILIGKTNVPEFGLGSNTYNPVHGITRNPYDPSRTPGGSSGGAAAALAERLVPVADGSDMMGSLRNPAAFCNVYGMRPTHGLVPARPLGDPLLHPISTDGPMARDPYDLAALLRTLSAPDPAWPLAVPRPRRETAPSGFARIGWLGSMGLPFEDGILEACEAALDATFEVEPAALPVETETVWEAWVALRAYAVAMKQRASWPGERGRMKEALVWEIETGLALSPAQIQEASEARVAVHAALAPLWERYDAIAAPSVQVMPFAVETEWPTRIAGRAMDTYHRWMEVMLLPSLLGLPAIACPAGFVGHLPTGFQLVGPKGADGPLLSLAARYHEATRWPQRRPPDGLRAPG